MADREERVWITYNGEIYNYLELRQELASLGWCFRSQSDTEVVLNAYQQWGPECLRRLNGMFAFGIWDTRHDRLFCARDRLGMKPFYYRLAADRMLFASEIKAILADPSQAAPPNQRTIHDYLVYGLQDHSEETFFEGIRQLRPGHSLLVEDGKLRIERWWDLGCGEPPRELSDEEAVESFRALFEDAVRLHLRSDVLVGSCLSGGLDSSSIVCTVHRLLKQHRAGGGKPTLGARLKTFTACFDDPRCDERPYVHPVVARADAESTEVFPDGRSLFEEMPRILWFQEEPLGSTSFLAQWAVMRAASDQGVHVLLDGQGGDELLCGYPGYWGSYLADLAGQWELGRLLHETSAYVRKQSRIPSTVFSNAARAVLPQWALDRARMRIKGHLPWVSRDLSGQYPDGAAYPTRFPTALENHVAAYLQTHSLPALLHHEDRNSMAFSIEARLPFLDVRLVDMLFRLPPRLKLRHGSTKFILRESMTDTLPETVRTREDKMGFATPMHRWLRETLRPDLEHLFETPSFSRRSYWDPVRIRTLYREFCAGRLRLADSVWRWACLELWHQRFFP
jgi:asparagine synthase (glutamine-hydrolysing)